MGGVSPLVGEALDLPGGEEAVLADPGDDVEADGVADAVRDEGLLPAAVHPDAAPAHHGGAPGAEGLVEGVLLVAEAAADVGLDDVDVCPGPAQGLAHHPADDVGDLGGAHHHDPAILLIGVAAVVLDVAVLDRGSLVPALDFDEPRLGNGLGVVALAHVRVLQDVAGAALVELGGVRLHGLLHVQHEGQLLILHLQRPDALHGGHLVLRDDHRHVVPVVADVPVQEVPVRHVLVSRVHGPGVARRGEGMLRHVEAGQDTDHAGDGLRRAGVHALHIAVGDGGVLDPDVERVLGHPVLVVFGAAGGLVIGVHPDLALAYDTHRAFLL